MGACQPVREVNYVVLLLEVSSEVFTVEGVSGVCVEASEPECKHVVAAMN